MLKLAFFAPTCPALFGAALFAASCASSSLDDSGQAASGNSSRAGADAGTSATASGGGPNDAVPPVVGGAPDDAACLGAAGRPTTGKSCGCTRDCDLAEACATETETFIPGGSCVRGCDDNSGCPADFECVELVADSPDRNTCFQTCTSSADCRSGHVCGPFAARESAAVAANLPAGDFCLPWCQSDQDCLGMACNPFTGACGTASPDVSDLGQTCTTENDCTQMCLLNPTPDGYCTTLCSVTRPGCPDGSVCADVLGASGGDFGLCLDECATVEDCRTGYKCLSAGGGKRVCFVAG